MLTLYAARNSCSICAHVALIEAKIDHQVRYVVLRSPTSPLLDVNPLGKVPCLQLDTGEVVTQSSVVLPHIADLNSGSGLLPQQGRERRLALQWLGFFNSDVHPALKMLAAPERYSSDPEALRHNYIVILTAFFRWVEEVLSASPWLCGETLCIADIYGCAAYNWARMFGMPLDDYPAYGRAARAFEARPSVIRARAMEHEWAASIGASGG